MHTKLGQTRLNWPQSKLDADVMCQAVLGSKVALLCTTIILPNFFVFHSGWCYTWFSWIIMWFHTCKISWCENSPTESLTSTANFIWLFWKDFFAPHWSLAQTCQSGNYSPHLDMLCLHHTTLNEPLLPLIYLCEHIWFMMGNKILIDVSALTCRYQTFERQGNNWQIDRSGQNTNEMQKWFWNSHLKLAVVVYMTNG